MNTIHTHSRADRFIDIIVDDAARVDFSVIIR